MTCQGLPGDLLQVNGGRRWPAALPEPTGTGRAAACHPRMVVFIALARRGLGGTWHRGASSDRHRGSQQWPVAALRTAGDVNTRPLLHPLRPGLGWGNGGVGRVSQGLPTLPQGVRFTSIGQETVMAYADKT